MDARRNDENSTVSPLAPRWLARQWVIAAASCLLVCLAVYHGAGRQLPAIGQQEFRAGQQQVAERVSRENSNVAPSEIRLAVDLNRATALELCLLPGIGPGLSARILSYRDANGPFRNLEQLDQVDGIGPRRLAQLRPYVLELNVSH
jgi:competence protein ComEA